MSEFRLLADNEVIVGKIGAAINNPAELNAHLEEPIEIKVMGTRVGNGKPRYVLLEVPQWVK